MSAKDWPAFEMTRRTTPASQDSELAQLRRAPTIRGIFYHHDVLRRALTGDLFFFDRLDAFPTLDKLLESVVRERMGRDLSAVTRIELAVWTG